MEKRTENEFEINPYAPPKTECTDIPPERRPFTTIRALWIFVLVFGFPVVLLIDVMAYCALAYFKQVVPCVFFISYGIVLTITYLWLWKKKCFVAFGWLMFLWCPFFLAYWIFDLEFQDLLGTFLIIGGLYTFGIGIASLIAKYLMEKSRTMQKPQAERNSKNEEY